MLRIFSGCFDTSGSMIALSVSEISALGGFCDEQHEEELGILVVGCCVNYTQCTILYTVLHCMYIVYTVSYYTEGVKLLHSKVPIFRLQSEEKKLHRPVVPVNVKSVTATDGPSFGKPQSIIWYL